MGEAAGHNPVEEYEHPRTTISSGTGRNGRSNPDSDSLPTSSFSPERHPDSRPLVMLQILSPVVINQPIQQVFYLTVLSAPNNVLFTREPELTSRGDRSVRNTRIVAELN